MSIIKLGFLLTCVFGFSNLGFGCHESALKPNDQAAKLLKDRFRLEARYQAIYTRVSKSADSDDECDRDLEECNSQLMAVYAKLENLGLFTRNK